MLVDQKGDPLASCSICLDLVLDRGERSIAKLQCGHEFHLDCIGSAFNAKGAMQCPNCKKVEKGRWLYAANGHSSFSDFNFDSWVTEDSCTYLLVFFLLVALHLLFAALLPEGPELF